MAAVLTAEVGRLWVPALDAVRFLPGQSTGRRSGHLALVTYAVRTAGGKKTQAGFGSGVVTVEGLRTRWQADEALQRQFPTLEAMLQAIRRRLVLAAKGIVHNERVDNGGKMVSKGFWGSTSSPTNATVNAPTRIALCTLATFTAAAHGDQSLASASANVTTNEATANGMARTGALTPSGVTDPSTLDGQFQLTLSNVFTDATAASDLYGAGLEDNTTTAFNQYAEAPFTHANPQVGDTLTVTWTVKD